MKSPAPLDVRTDGRGLYEITQDVSALVSEVGVCTVFIRHTSASLLIQENADPSVQSDLLAWLDRAVPQADAPEMGYLTHRAEGPDDMPAHIKAAFLPVSLQIPVADHQLALGRWQGIFVVEHRSAPQRRQVMVLCR